MKKLLILPTILFPYMVCLCLGYGFVCSFFDTTIAILAIASLVLLVASFVCNIIYFFTTKNITSAQLLKTAFLIKILHIPTYVAIYLLGLMMGLMFFMTSPFILFLVFVDLITLWLSGMISIYSLIRLLKDNSGISKALLIIALICQFVFCADIISLFILRISMKNKTVE